VADDRIEIAIELDDGSIRRGFAKLESEARGAAGAMGSIFSGASAPLIAAFAAAGAALASGAFLKSAIDEASEAENALTKLNTALKLAGDFSQKTSGQFRDLADEISRSTSFSDEQVLELGALARTYARTTDEAIRLTKASLDFASATGIDAESAVRKLGGTLSGELGAGLSKINPELKGFTQQQLAAGAAIDSFASKFSGAAVTNADTYSGAIAKAANAFSDLLESIGDYVVKSPAVIAVINFVGEALRKLASYITGFKGGSDPFRGIILGLLEFAKIITENVMPVLELLYNFSNFVFNAILTGVVALGTGFSGATNLIVQGLNAVGLVSDKTAADWAKNFESNKQALSGLANSTRESFNNISSDFSVTNAMSDGFNKLSLSVENASLKIDEYNGKVMGLAVSSEQLKAVNADEIPSIYQNMQSLSGEITSLGESTSLFKQGWTDAAYTIANDSKKAFIDSGARSINAFSGAVASGMSAVGRALVKGENLFEAFGAAMLSAIGQALVTEGAARILQGIARAFESYGLDPTAQGLIATGSAMTVAGSAMQAIGGSGGGGSSVSTSVPSGGGGSIGGAPADALSPADNLSRENQQRVVVNVQGDVLDSKESGMRIVDLLNEAFNSQGSRVIAT